MSRLAHLELVDAREDYVQLPLFINAIDIDSNIQQQKFWLLHCTVFEYLRVRVGAFRISRRLRRLCIPPSINAIDNKNKNRVLTHIDSNIWQQIFWLFHYTEKLLIFISMYIPCMSEQNYACDCTYTVHCLAFEKQVRQVITGWSKGWKVFSKCLCLCLCICHCICLSLSFFWSGHVSSSL